MILTIQQKYLIISPFYNIILLKRILNFIIGKQGILCTDFQTQKSVQVPKICTKIRTCMDLSVCMGTLQNKLFSIKPRSH